MAQEKTSKKQKSPRVSVTLNKHDSSRLDRLAQETERSRSWLGNYAIRKLLDDHKDGQLELPLVRE
jgi:predicted transcriptional regulator